MKKNHILSMFLLGWLLFSCQQNESIIPNDANIDRQLIREISSLKNAELKVAYSLLNNDEKDYFWTGRITSGNLTEGLSKQQKELLAELVQKITPESFIKDSPAQKQMKLYAHDYWLPKATEMFSNEKIKKILTLNSEEAPKDCDCNVDTWISDCDSPEH